MELKTFKNGIHPKGEKHHTKDMPIEVILPPKGCEMVYPVTQHIGAPCEPIVKVGQSVLLGEKIAESTAAFSSPIHSSVSGVVKEIRDNPTPIGQVVRSIIIENDGELKEHESIKLRASFENLSKKELLDIIREAGIVGLGGAGFPTHIKLSPPPDKKIDTVILNGAECEPYLTTDNRVMLEETERIVIGLQIVLQLIKGAKGVIAIEDNKPHAFAAISKAVQNVPNIEAVLLKTKYPQGSEKQLIKAVTGREVPSGGLPSDAGVIVDNVDTIIAIHRAVLRGRPLMRKVVTIVGKAVKKPGNYKIRLGMKYSDVIEAIGGLKEEPAKIIAGGPMMGVAVYAMDVPIVKTSSGIIFMDKAEATVPPETNCIRCGRCVAGCPIGLMPAELNKFALKDRLEEFLDYNGMDCIECGSCSYLCPSKRHLSQSIRAVRRAELAKRKK